MPILVAGTGQAFDLARGESLTVVNTHGHQVVDTWAFMRADPQRTTSTAKTIMHNRRLGLRIGDVIVDTTREPMLEVVVDTSPGVHDLLIPSCDAARYRQLGAAAHDNCHDNFLSAVARFGPEAPAGVPAPVNLFMNVPVAGDGSISIEPPVSGAGDAVTLRALVDLVVVLSACPQDLAPTNGIGATPADVEIVIGRAAS